VNKLTFMLNHVTKFYRRKTNYCSSSI
jgi:hypothetical protein